MRNLVTFKSKGGNNSLWYWSDIVSPLRVMFNYICMALARIAPSLRIKNMLYSAMGSRSKVCISRA